MYSERFGNPAAVQAGEFVRSGAIGRCSDYRTVLTEWGPDRAPTGFDPDKAGGTMWYWLIRWSVPLLYRIKEAEWTAQIGNFNTSEYPDTRIWRYECKESAGNRYIRIDWFTPIASIPGVMEGCSSYRTKATSNCVVYRHSRSRGRKPFCSLLTGKKQSITTATMYICPTVNRLWRCLSRTEATMTQDHCFLATELALRAQKWQLRLADNHSFCNKIY